MSIDVAEARERLEELIKQALRGEEVVITDASGEAVVLAPRPARSGFGSARGQIWMSDDFDDPIPGMEEYM